MSAKLIKCPDCGRANRVPAAAPGTPRCGNCHQPLPWIAGAGDDTFKQIAEQSPVPVLVDLRAEWCGPCTMVSPALQQVAAGLAGRIKLVKADLDQAPELQQRFGVQAIPALMILPNGHVAARRAGAAPASDLRAWVEQTIDREHGA